MKTNASERGQRLTGLELVMLACFAALLGFAVWLTVHFDVRARVDLAISSVIYLLVLLFSLVLLVACTVVHQDERAEKRRFEWLILLSFLSALFALTASLFNGRTTGAAALTMQIFANSLLGAYWIVFWIYQRRKYPQNDFDTFVSAVMIAYMSVYILFSFLNFFLPIFFATTPGGALLPRTDYFTLTYLSVWYIVYIVYVFARKGDGRTKLTLASYVILPLLLNIVSYLLADSLFFKNIYYALNSLCFLLPLYLIYFNLHVERGRRMQQQKEELTAARIHLTVSQIQPHFIYNSLTAIIGLIDLDPERAKESIVSFSDYLRVNLNAMKDSRLVPFEKELEHCKTYLGFELLRFDNIEVRYEIETTDFLLPALTVQPLMENAVKHGLSGAGVGGTVTLSVKEKGETVYVTVADNGVGFDPQAKAPGVHIGLENVQKRLSDLCGGTLTIDSKIGVGTTVTVTIPRKGGEVS